MRKLDRRLGALDVDGGGGAELLGVQREHLLRARVLERVDVFRAGGLLSRALLRRVGAAVGPGPVAAGEAASSSSSRVAHVTRKEFFANRYCSDEPEKKEEAEHQFLIDPFDRSVALVFQMFQSSDLDPWDVDLSNFIEMFNERISGADNIDLPSCGRLIRMAWAILRGQASSLIERQERAMDFEEDVSWDFDGGWETDFDDSEYNFSMGVMTGAADEVLPSIFEGRIHRGEGRPVTLGELLLGDRLPVSLTALDD